MSCRSSCSCAAVPGQVSCHVLTLPSQSASGRVFHSSRSRTPSSRFTVAHSGDTLVAASRGGSCCFRGFFRGLGSMLAGAGGGWAWASSPDSPGSEEVAEMVEEPLDSGRGGEVGEVSSAVPFTGVTAGSVSGLLRRIEGRGDPGTGLSAASWGCEGGRMGVMRAGVMVAGAGAGWAGAAASPGAGGGSVVMVTLLCCCSALSYISVVWLKLGSVMAGATTAPGRATVLRLTGPAWLAALPLAGTKVTRLATWPGPCCCGVTRATGTLAPGLVAGPDTGSWMVLAPAPADCVWVICTGARLTPDTSFMAPPAGTATRVLGGPTAPGTIGTWMCVAPVPGAGLVRDTASGWDTTVTVLWPALCTRTGTAPLTGLGFSATGAPDTDTWVVIGLNTPAGFWVTMVLVTEPGVWTRVTAVAAPVGESVGRAVVTRAVLGLKLTAAMVALGPATPSTAPGLGTAVGVAAGRVVAGCSRCTEPGEASLMLPLSPATAAAAGWAGARRVRAGATPRTRAPPPGWARMGRVAGVPGPGTTTLPPWIMVMEAPAPGLVTATVPTLVRGRTPGLGPGAGLAVLMRVGLMLVVCTVGILHRSPYKYLHSLFVS